MSNSTKSKTPSAVSVSETGNLLLSNYDVAVSLITDVGCQRENNEDSGACITPGNSERGNSKGVLAIVADGMGGHSAGEVASRLAVEVVGRVYYDLPESVEESLKQALLEANRYIYETAQSESKLAGMGTTCTALAIHNGLAFCAHVGDSRLYLVREGAIYLMSEDHSAVMEMVRRGIISYEAGQRHPDKNVLVRAMGTAPEITVSMWEQPFPLRLGDQFLLCSDGLYDLVTDDEIKDVVIRESVHEACEQLVQLAKDRGGSDNITVGILEIKPENEEGTQFVKDTRDMEVAR